MKPIKTLQIKTIERKFQKLNKQIIKLKLNQSDFSFFKTKDQTSTPTRMSFSRPAQIDWTDQLIGNEDLLWALYQNSYPGFKLAGCFTKKPIDIPIQLLGIPVPKCEDNEKIQTILTDWVSRNLKFFELNHRCSHIVGSSWIWPKYVRQLKDVIIEYLPDKIVLPPIKDIETGEIIQIVTDEIISIAYGEGDQITYCRRQRKFTKEFIEIKWTDKGALSAQLQDVRYRNVTGMLPINFANRIGLNESRGHSDYESILPDLKCYNDIYYQYAQALGKFTIKQVHTLGPDMKTDEWMTNNNIIDISTYKVYETDFIMNRNGEKDEFIFPNGAFDAYGKGLELSFWKLSEGSDIPEIFWGLNAAGNHASVEDSHGQIVKYTKSKQDQHTDNYAKLFKMITTLFGIATLNSKQYTIASEWNSLSSLDEKTRMVILQNFTSALNNLITSASATKKQIYNLWVELYPQITEDTFIEWEKGINKTAKHNAFKDAQYEMIVDIEGSDTSIPIEKGQGEVIPGKKLPEEDSEEEVNKGKAE